MKNPVLSSFAALIVLWVPVSAAGGECGLHAGLAVPLTVVDDLPLVRLTVDHKEAALLFDTGAEATILSTAAADRLALRRTMVYPRSMRGITGGVVGGAVELPRLAIAGVNIPNFGALVGSIDLPAMGGAVLDGLLGTDILSDFDLDIDLTHRRIRLLCAKSAPPWPPSHAMIEANRSLHGRLFFEATLDGMKIAAIIDSGTQHSVLDKDAAFRIGVTPEALSRDARGAIRGITGAGNTKGWLHRFRQLAIGAETVANPTLVIAPLGLIDADLILGADFLKRYRVWMSYQSHRIFIAPGS